MWLMKSLSNYKMIAKLAKLLMIYPGKQQYAGLCGADINVQSSSCNDCHCDNHHDHAT